MYLLFYRKMYLNSLPKMITFSGTVGLVTGIYTYGYVIENKIQYTKYTSLNLFTHLMGYISLGIITGVVYPISFPLCGYHVLKNIQF